MILNWEQDGQAVSVDSIAGRLTVQRNEFGRFNFLVDGHLVSTYQTFDEAEEACIDSIRYQRFKLVQELAMVAPSNLAHALISAHVKLHPFTGKLMNLANLREEVMAEFQAFVDSRNS